MSLSKTPPSTISGISRSAKKISREKGIKHTDALDLVSKSAGYQNYTHAKRQFLIQTQTVKLQPLFLTVYWHDRDANPSFGRCTAVVQLSPETLSTLPSLKDRGYWMLGGFELESADHLQARLDASSLRHAKKHITDAVRELQFCAATGLRRMRKQADKHRVRFFQSLPGKDHMSVWIESSTKNWIALDEPYSPRYASKKSDREKWITDHGIATTAPNWGGLYNPGNCIPYLLSADADFLQRITKTVEKLSPVPPIDWDTHSGHYASYFHSPERITSGKPYRPRPQPSYGKRAGALPYGGRPGVASDWRPAEPMSLKQHQALGAILQRLLWSKLSDHVYDKLSGIISTLDDWLAAEHSHEASSTLDRIYYGAVQSNHKNIDELRQEVGKAKNLVLTGYNDCRPRRDILKVLEAVEKNAIRLASKA